jgi:hypothetical protein
VNRPQSPSPTVDRDRPLPLALAGAAVAVFCLVGLLSAVVEVLLIPLHVGAHIFPVTVLIAVVLNAALPGLVARTVEWRAAIALPIVVWVIAVIVLGFANTGHGSVLVPGYGADEYVGLALFFVGALVGFVSVVRERGPAREVRTRAAPGRR